jgi:transcriptional regulator with XRE-family HTH domain
VALGLVIDHYRASRRLSQVALAERVLVSQATISRIERGKWLELLPQGERAQLDPLGRFEQAELLARIERALDLPAGELVAETDRVMASAEIAAQSVAGRSLEDVPPSSATGLLLFCVEVSSLLRAGVLEAAALHPPPAAPRPPS